MPLTEDQKKANVKAGRPANYDPSFGHIYSSQGEDLPFAGIENILNRGMATDEARYNALMPGAEAIGTAGAKANASQDQIIKDMMDAYAANSDPLQVAGYQGDYTSQAAGAHADPRAIADQRLAAKSFRENMTPELTDAERSMMELSRRDQERQQRGAREATLSSLQGRGFASGGDEIAAMLGSQQETGERRMLEDTEARGQAVGRAERARSGLAGVAGQMRGQSYTEAYGRGTAADQSAEHNANMRQAYDQFAAGFGQSERNAGWGRLMDTSGARAGAVSDEYTRAGDPWRYKAGVTSGQTGAGASNRGALVNALMARYGAQQAEDATDKLAPDRGMFGLGIGPF